MTEALDILELAEGTKLPIGTIRTWKGNKVQKYADGWRHYNPDAAPKDRDSRRGDDGEREYFSKNAPHHIPLKPNAQPGAKAGEGDPRKSVDYANHVRKINAGEIDMGAAMKRKKQHMDPALSHAIYDVQMHPDNAHMRMKGAKDWSVWSKGRKAAKGEGVQGLIGKMQKALDT